MTPLRALWIVFVDGKKRFELTSQSEQSHVLDAGKFYKV